VPGERNARILGLLLLAACRSPAPVAAPTDGSTPTIPAPPPAGTTPASAFVEGVAADIEGLAATYPQLAEFRASRHLDRTRLVIEYQRHTHAATHHGGWTSGVPNPDPDGIWLYVDLHESASTAQIHTQPVVPMRDVLGRKLMMLVLEGDATRPAAGALHSILEHRASESTADDPCGHRTDDEPPAAGEAAVPLVELLARRPRNGRFVTDGWAQDLHHCEPCPPGALCKPCEEVLWLSPAPGASVLPARDPLTLERDLRVEVPDATRFAVLGHYRVRVAACRYSSSADAPLRVELRGFAPAP